MADATIPFPEDPDFVQKIKDVSGGAGAAHARAVVVVDANSNPINPTGSGGPATIADGADVTQGHMADARSTATDTTPITAMQVLKELSYQAQNPATTPVSGVFWPATQPVSGAVTANAGTNLNTSALALETGGNLAATAASAASAATSTATTATNTGNTATSAATIATNTGTTATNTGRIPAQGAAVTAASLPVNVASDQTGTAGSPSTTVLSVQGVASGTAQPVAGNAASGAADSGNPVKIGGKYNATAPTLTDGQRGDLQIDANGYAKVTKATLDAGEDLTVGCVVIEQRFSPQAISTATTTTVKTGAGLLHSIVVTGGTAGTIIVYDNTAGSGTKIADFDSTNALATYPLNARFATGLTIVTGSATKLTANYR